MPDLEAALHAAGLALPPAPKPVASYIPAVMVSGGSLVFVSGQIPIKDGAMIAKGTVPREVSIPVAQECARQCVLNGLAALKACIGDLTRLRRVIRVGVFVACDPAFTEHPVVANGASDLLVQLLGDEGRHARAAVGAPCLPRAAPVEVEFLFAVS